MHPDWNKHRTRSFGRQIYMVLALFPNPDVTTPSLLGVHRRPGSARGRRASVWNPFDNIVWKRMGREEVSSTTVYPQVGLNRYEFVMYMASHDDPEPDS